MEIFSNYPEVHRGDKVDYAPNEKTPDKDWVLAEVTRTKNCAVDIKLADGRPKVDVRHADDPSLVKVPARLDSGVFRLSESQQRINRVLAEHDAMKRRMAALEETFRAVMANRGVASGMTDRVSESMPVSSARRSARMMPATSAGE